MTDTEGRPGFVGASPSGGGLGGIEGRPGFAGASPSVGGLGGPSRPAIEPIRWSSDRLILLDQTRLPTEEVDRECRTWEEVADAIRTLVVRGAPAIGVTAAFGVVLAARASHATSFDGLMTDLEDAIKELAATRPTAVNLFWALDRMRRTALASSTQSLDTIRARLVDEAQQ